MYLKVALGHNIYWAALALHPYKIHHPLPKKRGNKEIISTSTVRNIRNHDIVQGLPGEREKLTRVVSLSLLQRIVGTGLSEVTSFRSS